MPRAIVITAAHRFGRIGQLMKKCSCCGLNYVGDAVVYRSFGKRSRNRIDGLLEICRRCAKQANDKRRAPGRGYIAAMQQFGCQNPLCACTPAERRDRERLLHFHHRNPETKNFDMARAVDRPIGEMLNEWMLTIMLCGWSHGRAHNRGALSRYGQEVHEEWEARLAAFKRSREVGTGPVHHDQEGGSS